MKYKCLTSVLYKGTMKHEGDIIELDPEFADKWPQDYEKVKKVKKDGDTTTDTDKHDN